MGSKTLNGKLQASLSTTTDTKVAIFISQVRKLEFLLAEAVSNGCKHIISSGSIQSSHARSLAVACAQLGLRSHLFLAASSEKQVIEWHKYPFMDL